MSSNSSQSKSNEDKEVMVRQVNLAAAFHDHISCTKISQSSITTNSFRLQTSVAEINDPQNVAIGSMGSELSVPFESDHMYATDNKSGNDSNSLSANGIVRTNSLFNNSLSEEMNQISRLTEMILGQLDLIQHQQEQLLKKDRQLQGLKQDREALCLRLEKMEKRIAVLTAKVATNTANNVVINSNNNNICVNNSLNNNTINCNRNVINLSQNNSNITEDCDQSETDTIIEDTNSGVGLFADPTVFTKLYSNTSSVNSCNTSANNQNKTTISDNNSSKANSINTTLTSNTTNSLTNVKIKSEPQVKSDSDKSITTTTTTTSSALVRKSRKRQSEVSVPLNTTTVPTPTTNKKRRKVSNSCVVNTNDLKKEIIDLKETSSDSLSTLSTTQSNKTFNKINENKKKVVKQKCEIPFRIDKTHSTSSSLNCRTSSLTKDVLMTTKPYPIVVNNDYLPIELSVDNDKTNDLIDNKVDSSLNESQLSEQQRIEVPNWRLHPVSSCYSLEGTENLDDDVFNRRHLKLENDERRRKRWDIQRLREHRYNEKLRTGRYYSSSLGNCFVEKPSDLKEVKKKTEFTSFYPEIKNLQAIEVTEKIPFIAFGHPIPKLIQKSFSLPWNTSEVRPQTTSKARNTSQKKN